jgi:hypothetical protein
LLVLVTGSGIVRAQPVATEKKAAAQALFDDAQLLVKEGKYTEACPKFAESDRLDPAAGAKFYLADCLERAGKLASAWTYYVAVADAARAAGQPEKEKYARDRAEAVKPKLSRLVIAVPEASRAMAGLELERDGVSVGQAQWGAAIPVDAGEHLVSARAAGKKPWETRVPVLEQGQTVTVEVPVLEAAPPPKPRVGGPPAIPDGRDRQSDSSGSAQRIAGIVVGSAGVVGLGVGVAFGVSAISKQNESDADGHCDAANTCDDTGLALRGEAITAATVSTVGILAGGAALVGGVVLVLTAPSAPGPAAGVQSRSAPRRALQAARIVVTPAGIVVLGRW